MERLFSSSFLACSCLQGLLGQRARRTVLTCSCQAASVGVTQLERHVCSGRAGSHQPKPLPPQMSDKRCRT